MLLRNLEFIREQFPAGVPAGLENPTSQESKNTIFTWNRNVI